MLKVWVCPMGFSFLLVFLKAQQTRHPNTEFLEKTGICSFFFFCIFFQ